MPENVLLRFLDGTGKDVAENRLNRVLHVVRAHLGMDVAFISEFVNGCRVFRHVDAASEAHIEVGGSNLLDETYCQRVIDGRLPGLIPDTSTVPTAVAMPMTAALSVGAHLSVPIRLRDGRIYGTFCCFSHAPHHSLDQRDLNMMRVIADIMADQIDRDLETLQKRERSLARVRGAVEQAFRSRVDKRVIGREQCIGPAHARGQPEP